MEREVDMREILRLGETENVKQRERVHMKAKCESR